MFFFCTLCAYKLFFWPIEESKDKRAADFAKIFNPDNYDGSTVKKCIQKDVVLPFLFKTMQRAASSQKAFEQALINAYRFFGLEQPVSFPF